MITSGINNQTATPSIKSAPKGSSKKKSRFQNLQEQITNLQGKDTQGLSKASQNIQKETAKKKAEAAKAVQAEAGQIQYEKPELEKPEAPTQEQVKAPNEEDYKKVAEKLMPNIKGERRPQDQGGLLGNNPQDFNEYFRRFADEYENLQNQLGRSVDVGSENYMNELRRQAQLNYDKYLQALEKQRGEQRGKLEEKNKESSEKLKGFQEKGKYVGNVGKEGGLETSAQEINKVLEKGNNLDAIAALRGRFADPRFAAIDQQLMSQDIAEARGQAAQANRELESAKGNQAQAGKQFEENIQEYGKAQQEGQQEAEIELNKMYDDLKNNSKIQDLEGMKDQVTGKTREILDRMIQDETVKAIDKTLEGPLQEIENDTNSLFKEFNNKGILSTVSRQRIKERVNSVRKMLADLMGSNLPNYAKQNIQQKIQASLSRLQQVENQSEGNYGEGEGLGDYMPHNPLDWFS